METPQALFAHPDHAVVWHEDRLYLLDQRALPDTTAFVLCDTAADTARAIRDMVVRGAPAIGIAAAYGIVVAARTRFHAVANHWRDHLTADFDLLAAARPTAVNLFWALERMRAFVAELDHLDPVPALLAEAQRLHAEDIAANQTLGALGAALISGPTEVLTHCNAGALATGGYGTALGVVRSAHAAGKIRRVYADETRPWLQGSRLTAWELRHAGIPVTVQADAAAASLLAGGAVGWVIVGADRIAANGDTANKIGTYNLALAAHAHGVPFYVAAPTSTIDLSLPNGDAIPIEERPAREITHVGNEPITPEGVAVSNPAFDVTPARYITAIITEAGVAYPPFEQSLPEMVSRARELHRQRRFASAT